MANKRGIFLGHSSNNVLRDNVMDGNAYNFAVWGHELAAFINDVDASNTVDGKPIYYLVNAQDLIIDSQTYPDVGYLAVVNSTSITVRNLNIENNFEGILLAYTESSSIKGSTIYHNAKGIMLVCSSNNMIVGNNIINNDGGIFLDESSNNKIYHNNFLQNMLQVSIEGTVANVWDDGYPSGGNYWSDYTDIDVYSGPYQNQTGSDGIGDTPYIIDGYNRDRYPLMAPFTMFDAGTWNGEVYNVNVVSNSTASNFQLNTTLGMISLNVTGVEGTAGFCRITIPNIIVQDLWQGNYKVLLNGEPWPFRNWTDAANTYIYINYTHSEHKIVIVPESPSAIILPLFMVLSIIAVVFAKKKPPKKK